MTFLGVYGHVNLDTILVVDQLPGPDQTVPAKQRIERLGGTGGTIARAAASLGVPTGLSAYVGTDFPPEYRRQLRELGIDEAGLQTVDGPTPHCWIWSTRDGTDLCVIDQSSLSGDAVAAPTMSTMESATWVHLTTGDPAAHLAVAKAARKLSKRVAFDPAQELRYRYDSRSFEAALSASDLFFCNETELQKALSLQGYGDAVQLLDHTDSVVVTHGAQGAELVDRRGRRRVDAVPIPGGAPADSTGAGDVFRAGFYAALHAEQDAERAIGWGAASASLYLETGGSALPTRERLDKRLATLGPAVES